MPRISEARRREMDRILAEDREEIARWTRHLGKGASKSTQDVWPRRLASFCLAVKKTPGELVKLAIEENDRGQRTALRDLVDNYETKERARGVKGSTVAFSVKVLRSWLAHNGIQTPKGFLRVEDADAVYSELALSRDALRRVLLSASPRERAAVALMAFSGLRPMVLGNYSGNDGLRVRDLPDLEVDARKGTVSFAKVPARVLVRREVSKARHAYFTFLGAEGCEYVADYLRSRLRPAQAWKKGRPLRTDDPIIIPDRAHRSFVRTMNIGDLVRAAIRRGGLSSRPYVLRTTFATRLLSAEADGKVPHGFVQFWMGHQGDMTARYAQNRGLIPDEIIEQMRSAYAKCVPYLESVATAGTTDLSAELRKVLLLVAKVPEKEAEELATKSNEEVLAIVKERLLGAEANALARGTPIPPVKRPGEQRVVLADDVERFIEVGWSFKSPLNGSKAIVEWVGSLPSGP